MYHIKNIFLVVLLGVALTGCSTVSQLDVFSKPIERTPLNLSKPEVAELEQLKFIIITSENAEEVFAKLKKENTDAVLFGLTDEGYESLAKNFAHIRAYMLKQDAIINEYKEYYESGKPDSVE